MSNGMIFTIALLDTLEPGRITKRGRKCRFLHAWCAAVWDSGLKGCYPFYGQGLRPSENWF